MKKILVLFFVLIFTVLFVGNVYSQEEKKCIGPYDYDSVTNDYKSIVDDIYKNWIPDICKPKSSEVLSCHETTLLKLNLSFWLGEMMAKAPCQSKEGKRQLLSDLTVVKTASQEQTQLLAEIDIERYRNWKLTLPKIEKYFKSHPSYKIKINEYCNKK